jgi:hypothetical protein
MGSSLIVDDVHHGSPRVRRGFCGRSVASRIIGGRGIDDGRGSFDYPEATADRGAVRPVAAHRSHAIRCRDPAPVLRRVRTRDNFDISRERDCVFATGLSPIFPTIDCMASRLDEPGWRLRSTRLTRWTTLMPRSFAGFFQGRSPIGAKSAVPTNRCAWYLWRAGTGSLFRRPRSARRFGHQGAGQHQRAEARSGRSGRGAGSLGLRARQPPTFARQRLPGPLSAEALSEADRGGSELARAAPPSE